MLDTLVPIARWWVASSDPAVARGLQQALATGSLQPRAPRISAGALTPREREILVLATQGLDDREIAQRLHLELRTVEYHVAQARERLVARTRFHLACVAKDLGLL